MQFSVFRDDAVKVSSIASLLTQANEMLEEVHSHLNDYGERMDPAHPQPTDSNRLEIERLKQAIYEREDEVRVLRTERLGHAEEIEKLKDQLKATETTTVELTKTREESESALESRCRNAEAEVRRLTAENNSIAIKLKRALQQADSLIRTRESLLNIVALSEVTIQTPDEPTELPQLPQDHAEHEEGQ